MADALLRDVCRKLPTRRLAVHQDNIDLYRRAVNQARHSQNKIYSLHEPGVCRISKGKEHKKYEFGAKAAIVMTKANCVIVGAKDFSHNAYDGDTLQFVLSQVKNVRSAAPETAYCDRGFRGRKRVGGTSIALPDAPAASGTEHAKRKARKNFRRRSAIEPVIGRLKSDFRLTRNYLKGTIGDMINLLLAAAAFNCKKWMNSVSGGVFFVLFSLYATMRWEDEHQLVTS